MIGTRTDRTPFRWWSWPPPVPVTVPCIVRAALAVVAIALATGAIRATWHRHTGQTFAAGRPADQPSVRCVALTKAGNQCRNYAMRGTTLCRVHTKSRR